jgi:uncharacterized protein involved in exopolysaccharide biosynthesis
MELTAFFKFLSKNLKTLILIPVVTVVITYFLVKSLPDSYLAQGQIATGIVDKTDAISLTDAPPLQFSEIEQKFSNLIQMMQTQKVLRLVSYKLIVHDLTERLPFKKLSPAIEDLAPIEREKLVYLAISKYKTQQPLSRTIPLEARLDDAILSMKYDIGSIKDKLSVSRIAQSDYITISFESPNSELSSFTVNTICKEFIAYYTSIVQKTGERSVNYLSGLLAKKQKDLNDKMGVLKYYKIENNVLNLPEQARIVFGQMIEVENRQAETQKQIISLSGAITSIDNKFNPRDRKYFEATVSRVNSDIIDYKEKSKALNDKYIDNDFDPVYKKMYDSLQVLTTNKINEASDDYIFNPLAVKQDLIAKKIALQTERDLAKSSVNSLNQLHDKLFAQFRRLVPFEASIQSYERDIEIASQEYLDILDRYNNTSLQTTFIAKLKFTQEATPGALVPSKKMLLIILSGVISLVFCVIVLFVLFYLDDSIQSAKQLANATILPVIGQLDFISSTKINFNDLWNSSSNDFQLQDFKEQLRAIRLELNNELNGSKVLTIVSFDPNEGKTFLTLNLAYAYAVTSKKVLVIDGNFLNPGLTKSIKTTTYVEDFIQTGELHPDTNSTSAITILGNKGGGRSLLELSDESTTLKRFDYLKSLYDLILIEIPALTQTESSKEWFLISEKVIGVFEYKQYITDLKNQQLSFIKSLEGKFIGWIFNKFPAAPVKKSKKDKNA